VNSWLLLDSGRRPPAFNMALDEALLEAVARLQKPVLRFYGWTEPAATFGYFQRYADVERTTSLRPLIRRPTGGGIVPHDADWTYSLAFPPGHKWHSLKAEASYRRVHEWIQSAFKRVGVLVELAPASRKAGPGQCFVGHEKSDLLWHGRKIAGAAQRRNQLGLLIQGSVQPVMAGTSRCHVPACEAADGTVAPLHAARTAQRAAPTRPDWQQAMAEVGRMDWGANWSAFEPDAALRERAASLVRQKYSQPEFITKR